MTNIIHKCYYFPYLECRSFQGTCRVCDWIKIFIEVKENKEDINEQLNTNN